MKFFAVKVVISFEQAVDRTFFEGTQDAIIVSLAIFFRLFLFWVQFKPQSLLVARFSNLLL